MKHSFAPLFFAAALACSTQAQEEMPEAQEQIHEKGAPPTLEEKLKQCQEVESACTKGVEVNFPSFYSPDMVTISDKNKKALSALLSLELPADVTYRNAKENMCKFPSYFFDYNKRRYQEEAEDGGRGIFLTKDIVLTNFHGLKSYDYYFFYKYFRILKPSKKKDFESVIKDVVAIAPYYDLALLKLPEEIPDDVPPIPIGNFNETNPTLSYVSFGEGGILKVARERGTDLGGFDPGGLFIPPSIGTALISGEESRPGYSGSPILQEGKLIGLLAGSDHLVDNKYHFIWLTYHLPEFISAVLAKPAGEKE